MRDLADWENTRDKAEVEGYVTQGTVKRPVVKQATKLKRVLAHSKRETYSRPGTYHPVPSLAPTWGKTRV